MATKKRKPDLQTISLFLTLAVLTAVFAVAVKWLLLTPGSVVPPTAVEASKK